MLLQFIHIVYDVMDSYMLTVEENCVCHMYRFSSDYMAF